MFESYFIQFVQFKVIYMGVSNAVQRSYNTLAVLKK